MMMHERIKRKNKMKVNRSSLKKMMFKSLKPCDIFVIAHDKPYDSGEHIYLRTAHPPSKDEHGCYAINVKTGGALIGIYPTEWVLKLPFSLDFKLED
jgi:hypothetical protein